MGVITGSLETEQQPPITVPLRHFVVGFAFLVAGVGLGAGSNAVERSMETEDRRHGSPDAPF